MSHQAFQKVVLSPVRASFELFCFPWAGGNRSSLSSLYKLLAQCPINVYSVDYALKSVQKRANIATDLVLCLVEEFVEWLLSHRRNVDDDVPLVFFGYSYGGLLAYEVAVALEERLGVNVVKKIVLCAVSSPQFLTVKNIAGKDLVHRRGDVELMNHIIKIGGLAKGVDPIFLQMALPTIRADYTAFETYLCHEVIRKVHSDIHVLYSTEDEYTPSDEAVEGWRDCTSSGMFEVTRLENGSHFVFVESNEKLQLIVNAQTLRI
jgi:surfactin synthase thioesterase subunit